MRLVLHCSRIAIPVAGAMALCSAVAFAQTPGLPAKPIRLVVTLCLPRALGEPERNEWLRSDLLEALLQYAFARSWTDDHVLRLCDEEGSKREILRLETTRRYRETFERGDRLPCVLFRSCTARTLDDLHPGTGSDTGGARLDHAGRILIRADSTGGFDSHLRTDNLAHQFHIMDGRAATCKTCGRLDKVRTGFLGDQRCNGFLFIGQ